MISISWIISCIESFFFSAIFKEIPSDTQNNGTEKQIKQNKIMLCL